MVASDPARVVEAARGRGLPTSASSVTIAGMRIDLGAAGRSAG